MSKSGRPHVIVFFTDQQRWDSTGLHGNPLELTPHFDRLAANGTHLYHTFTCQPVCGPARSCMQTGRYATETGCFRNGIPLPRNARTLAHCFRAAGYRTGYIGKWHLGNDRIAGPVEQALRGGYEYWLASQALELTSDAYHTVLYDERNRPVELPGYRVDALTDAAIRFVDERRHQPFFLFLSLLEPHHQNHRDDFPPPDGYRERYSGRWTPPDLAALGGSAPQHLGGYWGMVKRVDEALGRLVDALKSLRILDQTILLFTSDHGCHFKTRNAEYKRSCHESSIRIPAFLHGPGFMGGGRILELISLLDLPPTILHAVGIRPPREMQGRSILPLLRGGRRVAWPKEVFIQISESQVGRAIRTSRWKYGVTAPDKNAWQDAGSDRYVEEFLYDLESDPYELCNLVGAEPFADVALDLRKRLLKRMKLAGERPARIDLAPVRSHGGQSPCLSRPR